MSDSPDNNGLPGVSTKVTPPVSDPRWQAAVQIASSACFRRSPRLKELWLYIARNSLLGRDDQLTESEIARQVFGRGVDYIQADDSIVRSSARQLRWKLKEALEKEETAWSVEIPKGRYVAQFQLRETDHIETLAPAPVSKKPQGWVLAGTLGAFLGVSIAINLWVMLRPASQTPLKERLGLVASLVLDRAGQSSVVLDDYAYVLMAPRPLLSGEELLSNYITHAYVPNAAAPSQDPALLKLWNLLGSRYIVSLGAAATEDRIIRSVPQHEQNRIVLRHARNVVARDFERGNYVLFGSTPNNPWTLLFEDQLNFRFARAANGTALFVNSAPEKGEAARYNISQQASVNSGPGSARVVYLPNLTHTGFVLLLTGLNMVTAEAAGEFATRDSALPTILRLFGAKRVEELPYFELLLRTSAVDNTPRAVSVVAYRRLGKS